MTALFFLLTILSGIFAQGFVSERLVNFSNAAATATNILSHKGLFTLGFSIYLFEMACQVITATLLYQLLNPVNRTVALAALLLEFIGAVIKTSARVFYIAPLFVLEAPASGATGLAASIFNGFTPEQLQSIALMLLKLNDQGAATALVFFGFSTPLFGYLIFRSQFLPRWLGVLVMVTGVGWLAFIYPPLGYRVFMVVALLGLLSSVVKIVWLLIRGVDEQKWKQQAAESAI